MQYVTIYARLEGVLIGISISYATYWLISKYFHPRKSAITNRSESDDDCNSLYYDIVLDSCKGKGFPVTKTIDHDVISKLRTVHSEYKFLPKEIYMQAVENLPIVCVDIVCQRKSDGKILLFYRRDEPAGSIWWLPGGRLLRGETFYEAAIRKIKDETGCSNALVNPIGIIETWNTFFPTSNWDKGRKNGKEGTQTVNICVVCYLDDNLQEFKINEASSTQWAVSSHRWVTYRDALVMGSYDKYVRLNVEKAFLKNLLLLP